MNKKIILTLVTFSLLLAGCGKTTPTTPAKQPGQTSLVEAAANKNTPAVTNEAVDYSQYVKKTWVVKNPADNASTVSSSFCITKIENGQITGRFTVEVPAVPNKYDLGQLTGTIDKDTAECQFSDKTGNKGTIKLVFKSNNEIEATIKYTDKAQAYKDKSLDGTFEFRPYTLKDIKGFTPFKDQSFTVDLNSWGSVEFVSGKLTGGNHIPTLFYLTDKAGDILYDFSAELPYSIDVKAVSFQDVNKDGLKDVIVICTDAYNVPAGSGAPIATVYFQKADGSFVNDPKLDQEINSTKNNKDINAVINYLSKKF